jgi:hypothetical protein
MSLLPRSAAGPGSNIGAEENHGSQSPKGNRYVRKLLTQATVKKKGSTF